MPPVQLTIEDKRDLLSDQSSLKSYLEAAKNDITDLPLREFKRQYLKGTPCTFRIPDMVDDKLLWLTMLDMHERHPDIYPQPK